VSRHGDVWGTEGVSSCTAQSELSDNDRISGALSLLKEHPVVIEKQAGWTPQLE
jgi:hypothetical protein